MAKLLAKEEEEIGLKEEKAEVDSEYDIIVLGATGVAGTYITRYLLTRAPQTTPPLRWAIAGRNKSKMEELLAALGKKEEENKEERKSREETEVVETIVCDVSNEESLRAMVSRAKLVINCTGPFRFLGENVIKQCAERGTHYIDICGEPEFMEKSAFKYFNTAQESGSIIVSACGFDSIPSDMGQEFVSQWFDRQKGICSSVECYVIQNMAKGYTVNKTTLEAALYGFAASKDLSKLRKELESVEWRHTRSGISRSGPVQKVQKELWFWAKRVNKYAMLFPFADSAVVANSQGVRSALLHHQGTAKTFPQFGCYLCFANGWELSTTLAAGAMMKTVGQLDWGRKLMLTYPWALTFGTFSSEGPTEEQIEASTFTSELFGEGYSEQVLSKYDNDPSKIPKSVAYDLRVHATVHGPDSGYHGTAVMCVESAICLLEEESVIRHGNVERGFPQVKGGVFTPSTIFSGTTLIDRLNEAGVKFIIQSLPDEEEEEEERKEEEQVRDRVREQNMEDGDDSAEWEDVQHPVVHKEMQ